MMEKQISYTREASDKAVDFLESMFKNSGVVKRTSIRIAEVVLIDSGNKFGVTTLDMLPINGFRVVESGTEDGLPKITVNIHDKMLEFMPKMYVTCDNCYNREELLAETAEMFGMDFEAGKSQQVQKCPCCEGDLGKRN